jgi:hypothetical protein
MWSLIPLAGFAFGLVLGRWWALAAALPLGAWILLTNELDGHIGAWVATVLSLLLACAIGAGVGIRRLSARRARA